jgi:hypothetical protein
MLRIFLLRPIADNSYDPDEKDAATDRFAIRIQHVFVQLQNELVFVI